MGFSDLPRWCYFTCRDGVLVNFYEPSSFKGNANGVPLRLEQTTEYPTEGLVEISVHPEKPLVFALKLRIPDWCTGRPGGTQKGAFRPVVFINGDAWTEMPQPGTILTIKREWHAGDKVTLNLPMPARVSCPVESAPGYCVIERGPLVLSMSQRFNQTGDGWCYAAPAIGPDGSIDLQKIAVNDPAGQAKVGWRTDAFSRYDIWGRIVPVRVPITLVPFSDAGIETEPYVAAFPLMKTLDSLPPRLGLESRPKAVVNSSRVTAVADSEANERASAARVIDGDPRTAWQSAGTPGLHWIEIRFAEQRTVSRIVLRFGERRNHPVDFKLVAGIAGREPSETLSVHDCDLGDYYWARFEPVNLNFVRLLIESSSGDTPGAAISEIDSYED